MKVAARDFQSGVEESAIFNLLKCKKGIINPQLGTCR